MFGGDFDEKYFVFWGFIGNWFLTQGALLCGDDNFGWVVVLDIGYLRRGPSFVGMTILGVIALEWGIGYLRRGPSFVGMTRFGWVEGLLI